MDDLLIEQQALMKAKVAILAAPDSAFLADICFSLVHKFDENIPTTCTNGVYVKYSPTFFMELDTQERVFLVLHETLHVAFMHMIRCEDKNKQKYNQAADYVINAFLKKAGFKMPKEGLFDPQYDGMSTEEVYKLLPDDPTGPTAWDDLVSDTDTPEDIKERTEAINDILIRASMSAKAAGNKPGSIPKELEIYIDKLVEPKLPWHRIINKYFNSLTKNDYSFKNPNKRFLPNYLPSLYSEGLGHIAIAVDSSGSVSDTDFNSFVSEISYLLNKYKPTNISLITFDTKIKSIDEIKNNNELKKVKFVGRGGTDVLDLLNWVNKNKPVLTLVFTDGEFHKHDLTVKSPIVWIIHNNKQFTYKGKVVHYDL